MDRTITTGGNQYRKKGKKKTPKAWALLFVIPVILLILFIYPIPEEGGSANPLSTFKDKLSSLFGLQELPQLQEILLPDDRTIVGPFPFVRAKDGDTIVLLDENGNEFTVRLIGIDTPESVHVDESKNTEEGRVASDWLKKQFQEGLPHQLYLEYDIVTEDEYGRTLAYVYLDDKGDQMLNKYIIESGYATTLTIPPNNKYSHIFYASYLDARLSGRGLWADEQL